VLAQIHASKAARLATEMAVEPYDDLVRRASARRAERRPFRQRLQQSEDVAVIAEIKAGSPSAGVIAAQLDPAALARVYETAGADALSVLTESEYFFGDLSHLTDVRRATRLPLLRKDFLWTRYQIAQSAAYGADCVLLILTMLSDASLLECLDEATRYNLDVLVEIRDELELARAISVDATLVGVNNRDLHTFAVDLSAGQRLLTRIPQGVFAVAESGIRRGVDATGLSAAGALGLLVGEALVRSADPSSLIAELRHACCGAHRRLDDTPFA
jgi:indole-3-glycerol phosphate synthase